MTHQIVFLEHEDTRLYAELIQVVESRQMWWVRPLLLGFFPSGQPSDQPSPIYDLRSSAHLLWPMTLFRPAFDTEVIPLLSHLLALEPQLEQDPAAQQQLNQFVYKVWQAHYAISTNNIVTQ